MFSTASIFYLVINVCIALIHARLIPIQDIVDTSLAIDTLLSNDLPLIASEVLPINRVGNLPSTKGAKANTNICYPVVGCFDNNSPFDNAGLEVPQAPEFVNTQFLLFTQEAPNTAQIFSYNDTNQTIRESTLNSERWLRIIVHGFFNNRDSSWIKPLKDELLRSKDNQLSDVLVVDWGNGAKFPFYANAAANTRLVGKQLGIFLQTLQVKGFSFDKIHCIGHSLGAHTCALASNVINNQMGRISGLDPAGPFFEGKNVAVRLDISDAKFIDIIHSNADVAFGLALGSAQTSGHVDFYVNGGENQPGCPSVISLIGSVFNGQSKEAYAQSSCSHGRSHGYYIESINSECPYTAFPCHNYESFINGQCTTCSPAGCARMGFHSIDSPGRGNMYLTTRDATPFCGYHYVIEIELDRSMMKTTGEIYVAIHSNYEMLVNVSMTSKSNADLKSGDILRHVVTYKTTLGEVDFAVVYFNKGQSFFGLSASKSNDIVLSRLRVQSLDDTDVYTGLCQSNKKVTAYSSETIMLNRADCAD